MASKFTQPSRFLTRAACQVQIAAVILCGAVAFTSVAAADPLKAALVESTSDNISGVAVMDYLHSGQVIQLHPYQTIVLSYEISCVRETITGGMVTVGIDRSQVVAGQVSRSEYARCDESNKPVLTSTRSAAGRNFRGAPTR